MSGCVKSREKVRKENMSEEKRKQHFVLVHGACHGAWCWYKVKPLLEALGHRVTALDLAASGIDTTRSITDISTCEQYSEPLMQLMTSLPNDEKVVLVGHSFGGLSLALAMDKFPDKISVSVFVTAFMPDTKHSPSFVEEKFASSMTPEGWMGSELETYGSDNSGLSVFFSTDFMKHRLYQLSPVEDLELGLLLKRPSSLFINELSKMENFSEKGYGSVPRAYIVCKEDNIISEDHQRWMIHNYPANLVIEMEETDHMPMFCKPQLLSDHLLAIADNFC
ncbi:acetone-cyanohydrin lyase [Arabidopsis thaliana]|nr:acetone-cyanohydrin lyase [Arabidopsis thaliana]ANM61446.1 acetone-cyanohydrin lyase [Arabidopsis thaliana]|eukprot:NP_001323663.1 acetone-cyanohydrin lyase [Arabidopsis thaliana]